MPLLLKKKPFYDLIFSKMSLESIQSLIQAASVLLQIAALWRSNLIKEAFVSFSIVTAEFLTLEGILSKFLGRKFCVAVFQVITINCTTKFAFFRNQMRKRGSKYLSMKAKLEKRVDEKALEWAL